MNLHPSDERPELNPAAAADGVRTLRMTIAYDGTGYCGWQVQPNGIALQAVFEQALSEFTGESVRVVASGRTDAGVHAIGQVISFTTRATTPCHGFLNGLPRYLPDDVVVRDVQESADGFNARYDAKRKWYRYLIHNTTVRVPFLRNAVLWQRSRLDDRAMHAAVQHLVGTHDFRCFETQWPNRSSSVRTVFRASVIRTGTWDAWQTTDLSGECVPFGAGPTVRRGEHSRPAAEISVASADPESPVHPMTNPFPGTDSKSQQELLLEPPFICFDIEADGFLYNMVRAIVGTLIHVGRGRWTADDMRRILETGDRTHAGETAPPQGLYLMRVDYDSMHE